MIEATQVIERVIIGIRRRRCLHRANRQRSVVVQHLGDIDLSEEYVMYQTVGPKLLSHVALVVAAHTEALSMEKLAVGICYDAPESARA